MVQRDRLASNATTRRQLTAAAADYDKDLPSVNWVPRTWCRGLRQALGHRCDKKSDATFRLNPSSPPTATTHRTVSHPWHLYPHCCCNYRKQWVVPPALNFAHYFFLGGSRKSSKSFKQEPSASEVKTGLQAHQHELSALGIKKLFCMRLCNVSK